VTEEYIEDGRPARPARQLLPAYVLVLRIHGPFLFGATEKLSEATVDVESLPACSNTALAKYDRIMTQQDCMSWRNFMTVCNLRDGHYYCAGEEPARRIIKAVAVPQESW
jgi:hypothetical protein